MVEVYLPPAREATLGIRVDGNEEARCLFEVFAAERDEVLMAVLGPLAELRAVVAFGDVPLGCIEADPGPLVTLARGLGGHRVMVAHLADEMVVDGSEELAARRAVGAALAVDGVDLAEWLTMPATPIGQAASIGQPWPAEDASPRLE